MQKITEKDRENIIQYISDEKEVNLFIYGDIENFGVDCETVEFFAQLAQDGGYRCILMRYLDHYVIYSKDLNYDPAQVANFLSQRVWHMINGKGEVLELLFSAMQPAELRTTFLSKLTSVIDNDQLEDRYLIRPLCSDDARSIVELFSDTEEFAKDYIGREEAQIANLQTNLSGGGRGYGAFLNDQLIGTAMTSAESSVGAMLIGVATRKGHRKKGIASRLVATLCDSCLKDGLEFICLFYDNIEAGAVYHRIGFEDIGTYGMLRRATLES